MAQESKTGGNADGRGSCLCGAVSFRMRNGPHRMHWCHCTMCRKFHGNAMPAVLVRDEDWEWLGDSEEKVRWHRSSDWGERGSCSVCSSALFFRTSGMGRIAVTAGALDDPVHIRLVDHLYAADKGDWYDLPQDGAPRYPQDWPEEVKKRDKHPRP